MFKVRKTRQKLALSLTPLGTVAAAAEATGYKKRRLGKSQVYGSTRDWSSLYGSMRSESETAAQSSSGTTQAVSLLRATQWVQ